MLSLLFPNSDLVSLFNAIAKANIDEGMRDLKNYSCPGKIAFSEIPVTVGFNLKSTEQPELVKEIDNQLENSHRIVAIQFDPNFILKPEHRSVRPLLDLFFRKEKHYASVVARKFINGKCQYLIRDSSGENCDLYEDERCDKSDPGNVWATSDELAKNISFITYLKKKETP